MGAFREWLFTPRGAIVYFGTCYAVIGLILFASWSARAHRHDRADLDDWFTGLKSEKGPCCGSPKVDAVVLQDPDWESKDGRYRVRIEGEWHDVPPEAVLNVPNRYGPTLVWPTRGYGGLSIRCFLPGAMT